MRHDKISDLFGFKARNAIAIAALAMMVALFYCAVAYAAPESQTSASSQGAQGGTDVTKSEVVYGMLNSDGSVRTTYVVNRFASNAPCRWTDYGAYTLVSNLSTAQPLICENEKVAFDMGEDPFFYQGTLKDAQLPWVVNLTYTLDGNAIAPKDLARASGKLNIALKTNANQKVNLAFYESFVLQVTFTLDGANCTDIQAEGATIAASGEDHTIAFTVLPGHDGSFNLSAQVKDFEMPSVQIAALPYSSVIEMPDTSEMEGGLESLSSAISQLNQGTAELANGAAQLSTGADSLAGGAKQFGNGLSTLASSSTQIVSASSQIKDVLVQIANALKDVDVSKTDEVKEYAPVLRSLAEELQALKITLRAVDEDYMRTATMLNNLAIVVYNNPLSDAEIASLRAEVADDPEAAASLEKLLTTYFALRSALDEYFASGGDPATIAAQLEVFLADGGEFDQAVNAMLTAADFLENGGIDQIEQLVTGLSDLSNGYSQFHDGLVAYTQGVKALNDNYSALSSGMSQFADGTTEFASGANQLSSGVSQLNASTNNLPAQMRERMGEMMADYDFPEFDPVSFVDERNKNVTAVQFVLLTDAIEKPADEVAEAEPEPEPTMWDRFLALFGL